MKQIASTVAAERQRCADICNGMVTALKMGTGSYTMMEREMCIATAQWLADEISNEEEKTE